MTNAVDKAVAELRRHSYRFANEAQLQDGIAAVLDKAGIAYEREARLSDGERPDFVVGDAAIEVKVGGSASDMLRQMYRYAELESVARLVLLTSNRRIARALPRTLLGKPSEAALLRRTGGV